MADSLVDLRARAEASRADAEAVQEQATRLAEAVAQMQADLRSKLEAADRAADEVAQEEARRGADDATAEAERLGLQADQLELTSARATNEATAAITRAQLARGLANGARALATRLRADIKPVGNYVRLDGGGFVEVQPPVGRRDSRVTGINGSTYDHVADHPSGAWIYRASGR